MVGWATPIQLLELAVGGCVPHILRKKGDSEEHEPAKELDALDSEKGMPLETKSGVADLLRCWQYASILPKCFDVARISCPI